MEHTIDVSTLIYITYTDIDTLDGMKHFLNIIIERSYS